MKTVAESSEVSAEILADLDQVCRLAASGGAVLDPDLLRRVQERAEKVRQDVFEKHGLLNVAVDLIRETRDEE